MAKTGAEHVAKTKGAPSGDEQIPGVLGKSSFGNFLQSVIKAKIAPEQIERRRRARMKRRENAEQEEPQADLPEEESPLQEHVDNLATAATSLRVKPDGSVHISMDLEEMPTDRTGKKVGLGRVFTGDVKEFEIEVVRDEEGEEIPVLKKRVRRGIIDGEIVYYHEDEEGKKVPLELPEMGTAKVKILPEDVLDLSRGDLLRRMRREVIACRKGFEEDVGDDLLPKPEREPSEPRRGRGDRRDEEPRRGGGGHGGRTRGYSGGEERHYGGRRGGDVYDDGQELPPEPRRQRVADVDPQGEEPSPSGGQPLDPGGSAEVDGDVADAAPEPVVSEEERPEEEVETAGSRAGRIIEKFHKTQEPMIVAHRGYTRNGAPENSTKSIDDAIEHGVHMVELDVRKTKDGHYVIIHDSTVDRTTNGHGSVSSLTLAQLKALRLKKGRGGPNAKITDFQIPTLEEVLLAAKGRIMINLHTVVPISDDLIEICKKTGTLDHLVFKGKRLQAPSSELTYMPVLPCKDGYSKSVLEQLVALDPPAVEVRRHNSAAGKRYIKELTARGIRVWVNNLGSRGKSDEKVERLLARGVSLIQTDLYCQRSEEHLIREA